MHAFFCLLSFVVVYFTYPETAGVPLEEMDALFGEKTISSVPQGDDTDDEDEEQEQEERRSRSRPIRTSISSHPRFQSQEERDARIVASRIAAENRSKEWSWSRNLNPRNWLSRITGYDANQPDRRLYETVAGNE